MLYRLEQPHPRNCYYLEYLEEYEKYLLVQILKIKAQKLKAVLGGRLTIIETGGGRDWSQPCNVIFLGTWPRKLSPAWLLSPALLTKLNGGEFQGVSRCHPTAPSHCF